VLGLAAVAVALYLLVPPSWAQWGVGDLVSVTVLEPWLAQALQIGALVGVLTPLVLTVVALVARRPLWALLGIAALPIFGVGLALGSFNSCSGWTLHDTLVANDGQRYQFLDTSCLQAQLMAIGRPRSGVAPLTRSFDVVAWTNGDSPRRWRPIVRPAATAHDDYGQLYIAPNGLIVGVRNDNRMFMAYDPATGTPFRGEAIEAMSPYVLLDGITPPHGPDLNKLS
jgi:hypothetical protein